MNKEKDIKELIDSMIGCIKFKEERIKKLEEEIIDLRADYGTKTQIERDLAIDKIEELEEYIERLKEENKKLKAELELYRDNELYLNNKIDKVIEYISKHNCIATYEEYKPTEYEYCCSSDLLEILKGEDNE